MKLSIKLIVVLYCLVLAGCAGTGERMGAASFRNEPEGFRGVKWGQNIGELKNMRLVSRDTKGLSIYRLSDDLLYLDKAKLNRVLYLFWQKKFFEAQLISDPDQLQALKNALNEKYGEGHNPYKPSSTQSSLILRYDCSLGSRFAPNPTKKLPTCCYSYSKKYFTNSVSNL